MLREEIAFKYDVARGKQPNGVMLKRNNCVTSDPQVPLCYVANVVYTD